MEHGYSSINIKTLSKKIGCSTQPLVWQFDNMEGLREAIADYALDYANQRILAIQKMYAPIDPLIAFFNAGMTFIDIAFDEPNLFCFLYTSGESGYFAGGFDAFSTSGENAAMVEKIAGQLKISKENAGVYYKNMMIYTYGLASVIASGMITATKEEVGQMMKQVSTGLKLQIGVDN